MRTSVGIWRVKLMTIGPVLVDTLMPEAQVTKLACTANSVRESTERALLPTVSIDGNVIEAS